MLRYQFIGQSDEEVKRGPDATTGSLSYDRSQILKGLRRYDDGLAESLCNTRRRVVGLFKSCYDTATLCCRGNVRLKERDMWPRMQTDVNLLLRASQHVSACMIHRPR